MSHPSSETLARFVAGSLDGEARGEVERELARCAECRSAVGALARLVPATRASDAPPPMPKGIAIGTQIGGRYRVIRFLGEGGMGAVHEVEHELLGRRFAMKTLHPAQASSPDVVRRFTAEARAAAAIEHPAIVDVVDLGRTDEGAPFLVMELLEGETLAGWLDQRARASVDDTLAVGEALASALAAAHARGIVHRDVKPANVFLLGARSAPDRGPRTEAPASGADGSEPCSRAVDPTRVKLLDFGVAKLADAERTRSGMLLGTPRYMAPEQWLAAPDVDARVDVFAVGVVLFRMLSGELPYDWASFTVESGEAPSLRAHGVAPALAELVERCIARDREARPASMSVVVDGIAAIRATRERIQRGTSSEALYEAPVHAHRGVRAVVGRERERAALSATVISGRAVALVGPPGIGKSALLSEWARAEDGPRIEVYVEPGDAERPLRALARALALDEPSDVSSDQPAHGPSARARAGHSGSDRLALAVARRLDTIPPGTLVVIDGATLDLRSARALAARLADGLRIVVATRDEACPVIEALGATVLTLRGLDLEGVAALAVLHGRAVDVASLEARTGGNPLFLEQLLALDAPREGWPADVHAAVRARIAALPAEEARAWRIAAAVGGAFEASDLEALGVLDAAVVIDALVARDVFRKGERGLVAFSADVLREVAYTLVPTDARVALHGEIARLRARVSTPDWAEVARHHEEAREEERARDAYARAAIEATASVSAGRRAELAKRALALGARSLELQLICADELELGAQFEAALEALDRATPDDARGRAEVLLRRGVVLQRLGRDEEAFVLLEKACVEARASQSHETLARALGKHAVALGYARQLEAARDGLEEAERVVVVKAPSLRAEAAIWRAQIAGVGGDLGDRRNAYWAAVELYREVGDLRLAAGASMNLADTYNQLGAFDEAERSLVSARADCLALGVRSMAGYAALNLGYARTELGRFEEAAAALDEADHASESGDGRLARFVMVYRGRLERRRGQLDAAALVLRAAIARCEETSDEGTGALAETALARVELERGEPAAGLVVAESALRKLATMGALEEGEAELHWTHARCLAALGRAAEARAAHARGAAFVRSLARRVGDREWRARLTEDVEAHRALLSTEP